jgi:hypothetical protein
VFPRGLLRTFWKEMGFAREGGQQNAQTARDFFTPLVECTR